MSTNLLAITLSDPVYPGFVSINREDDGSVTVIVRQAPRTVDGVRVCGQTCKSRGPGCNNYCNFDQSKPMADRPEALEITQAGHQVSLKVSAEQWDAAVAGLLAG